MFSVDKEASIEAIHAARDIFQAFGSTRLLGYAMLILGVYLLAGGEKATPETLLCGLWIVAGGFGVLAVSYLFRPHDAKSKRTPAKVEEEAPAGTPR